MHILKVNYHSQCNPYIVISLLITITIGWQYNTHIYNVCYVFNPLLLDIDITLFLLVVQLLKDPYNINLMFQINEYALIKWSYCDFDYTPDTN